MPARSVSILGCGWLGLPLAKYLVEAGCAVRGSTTSPGKLATLEENHIHPFLIQCTPQIEGKDIASFFLSSVLFLNIPFERRLADPRFYQEQIQSVVDAVRVSPVEFAIFASSTAVYPEALGLAAEDQVFCPDNPRSQVLYDVEQLLLNDSRFQATVVRFGGLYGPGRPLGRFMAGRKGLSDGHKPANLVHLEDCVRVVAEIIARDIRGEIFNAVSDAHPTRKSLYTQAARRLGLEPPEFLEEPARPYKVVSNAKLKKMLNFVFRHPDPMESPGNSDKIPRAHEAERQSGYDF